MLSEEQFSLLAEATLKKTAALGLKHASENLKYIKKTIKDLKRELRGQQPRPSLVVSGGPSLHRMKSLETIKEKGFNGYIVTADGSMGHCFRNGIIPDFVVTVDPDPHRIIRWFGDPRLSERPEDDYFERQDLDPALNTDQIAKNEELIELVNRFGPEIKLIISTSVTPEIAQRCIEAGMELYWWNPLYDDYENPESITRKIYEMNKVPCMVTGGNVGASAWVFAHTVLGSPAIILVGMDCSYPPGTSVRNTQYYEHLLELFPDNLERGLVKVYNPFLNETWITDPGYYWYAQIFQKMAPLASCITYNCTEGGILFGKGIEFARLSDVLDRFNQPDDQATVPKEKG